MQIHNETEFAQPGVRYYPPKGVTPALARLIWRGEYDLKVFTAALVTLAAKGWIIISDAPSGSVLRQTDAGGELIPRERGMLHRLFTGRDTLALNGGSYLDLKATQTQHFDVLMEEDDAYFCAPLAENPIVNAIAGWLWPIQAQRTRRLRKHVEGYRCYLNTSMRHRLDPVFQPGGKLTDICTAMPYIIAFDIENSWADEFSAKMAELLTDTIGTTGLHDLGDRALARSRRQQRYLAGMHEPTLDK